MTRSPINAGARYRTSCERCFRSYPRKSSVGLVEQRSDGARRYRSGIAEHDLGEATGGGEAMPAQPIEELVGAVGEGVMAAGRYRRSNRRAVARIRAAHPGCGSWKHGRDVCCVMCPKCMRIAWKRFTAVVSEVARREVCRAHRLRNEAVHPEQGAQVSEVEQ